MNPTPHEALLEHRTFLLRLARSLVRDESTAEDVVQEASAAYLASPPRDVLSSRAWLAQVVRRMAGKSHRARARAAAREAAVARPDLEPNPTDETDRQLDAQATLIQFLQALPETQREAVKLRYHDDLSPKAIAKRLGVPVSTVHSRLQRALGKLRIEMDRSAGGQRDQWAAALLPASTKLAVAGAAGAAGGSVTAPSALPWVLGAVAATVLAGIYLLPGNEPEPGPNLRSWRLQKRLTPPFKIQRSRWTHMDPASRSSRQRCESKASRATTTGLTTSESSCLWMHQGRGRLISVT